MPSSVDLKTLLIASIAALCCCDCARAEDGPTTLETIFEVTLDIAVGSRFQVASTANFEVFEPHLSAIRDARLSRDYSLDRYGQRSRAPIIVSDDSPTTSAACDLRFLRANAIFIHATTYCPKDYMDSRVGFYALTRSRRCTSIGEDKLRSVMMSAMEELDAVVNQQGKAAACRWVDAVAKDIESALP